MFCEIRELCTTVHACTRVHTYTHTSYRNLKVGIAMGGIILTALICIKMGLNPLNAELNPICHLLALLGAHHILHISRIRVKTVWLCMVSNKLDFNSNYCQRLRAFNFTVLFKADAEGLRKHGRYIVYIK